MFVVPNYPVAVVLCFITMLCWGSWANTQKLAGARWRFELFYWDYVLGVMLMALVFALTLGSMGTEGRSFLADLQQADARWIGSALVGGAVFNLANILLVAAIAIAGMSVAFPVGIGLALVLGVLVNYFKPGADRANAVWLFVGVALVLVAIILDAIAYRRLPQQKQAGMKGIVLSVICGVLMGFFYRFVADAIAPWQKDAQSGALVLEAGKLSPYTAVVFFSLGILLSNFVINTAIMLRPFVGDPVPLGAYFQGSALDHLWGIVGGMIWQVGMTLSILAGDKATFAISYGLGQGATMVAAFWGVFIWREFREAPAGTGRLLALMFAGYIVGLALIIAARVMG
ncbi:MAG TPA: GRP family sugar transporter [Thermoguttaceae bacterium]|nr:GRP family sugar transporter [Thermoguttaceae bacterium]